MTQELIELTLNSRIRNEPSQIARIIFDLAEQIESCKNDLTQIKSRGLWDLLFSSNTRDLADAMLKENDTISLFLSIVQSLIVMNMANAEMLGRIQDELNAQEKSRGKYQNKYISMAKEYIAQSYTAATRLKKKIEENSDEIAEIESALKKEIRTNKEQAMEIAELKKASEQTAVLVNTQNRKVAFLEKQIKLQEKKTDVQSDMLPEVRERATKTGTIVYMKKLFGWLLLLFGILGFSIEIGDLLQGTSKHRSAGYTLALFCIFVGYRLISAAKQKKTITEDEKTQSQTFTQ